MDDQISTHQINTHTFRGRHVELMEMTAGFLADRAEKRVLSFGCSNGSECLDLAQVFTDSEIVGVDVNEKVLTQAKAINHPRIKIAHSTHENVRNFGPYDAIFAMNVLCLYPQADGLDDISEKYPFSKFEEQIDRLDNSLKINGVLVLFNCHYFFDDCQVSKNYSPLATGAVLHGAWMSRYRPDGKLATRVMVGYDGQSFTHDEWRKFKSENPSAEHDTNWHDWVNPLEFSGRETEVSLWRKHTVL